MGMLFLLFFTHIYFSLVKNFFPFAIDYQYFNLSEIYSKTALGICKSYHLCSYLQVSIIIPRSKETHNYSV